MMDNLNLKPQSPDEVKTMMWTGENQREMFDLLTCGKKIDDYMTASGENFFIDHSTVKGGLVLIANIGNQCGCKIPVKIGDYVCGRRYGDKWCFSVADGTAFENNTCGTLEKREGKEKPIDIFKNQEQLEECLREWQHRLFLDGWLILAHVKDKIMNPNGEEVIDAAGYNTFIFESSQANTERFRWRNRSLRLTLIFRHRRNAERILSTIWQIASRSTISMRQRLFLMS